CRAGTRDPEASKIFDAGLCHGTLGTAHMLNRLYQATGDEALGVQAQAWLARGLAARREGRGVGGYAFYYAPDGKTTRWVDDPSFLSGAAGVALALLAFASDAEPTWDSLLLLSSGHVGA
ncbi:MAG TPA: lanthionine synthetase LanC family protein, partial [Polyangiaceae bacterium]|nr:lanthionine synthetase LanC family protein [Polyangiaceae bacterium]